MAERRYRYQVCIRCYTYNHSKYIINALNGFVMQITDFPYLIMLVDDASTDGSQDIIANYVQENFDLSNQDSEVIETNDAYILYARHKTNRNCFILVHYLKYNHYKKKNKLPYLQKWRDESKYEALCEGDDYWTDSRKLQKQVKALELNPDCVISFAKVNVVSPHHEDLKWSIPTENVFKEGLVSLADYTSEEFFNGRWTFHTSSFVFRLECFSQYPNIDVFKLFPYGDMPLLLYYLTIGTGYYLNDVVGCYRFLSGGYNSKVQSDKTFAIQQEKRLIRALLAFDKYTAYKYHNDISKKIYRSQFKVDHMALGRMMYLKCRYWKLLPNILFEKIKILYHHNM